MVCGEDLTTDCISDETALSTELFTPRATVDPSDTRHAICGADAQWHGAFPKCIECDVDAIAAGRAARSAYLGSMINRRLQTLAGVTANATSASRAARSTPAPTASSCATRASSPIRGRKQPGQSRATCTLVGQSVQLGLFGQCVDPACVDNGD
jgi:hypothetical protein